MLFNAALMKSKELYSFKLKEEDAYGAPGSDIERKTHVYQGHVLSHLLLEMLRLTQAVEWSPINFKFRDSISGP